MDATSDNRTIYLTLQFEAGDMFVPEDQRSDVVKAMYQAADSMGGHFVRAVDDDNRPLLVQAFAKEKLLVWAYEKRLNRESVRIIMDTPIDERADEICAKLDPSYNRISGFGPPMWST